MSDSNTNDSITQGELKFCAAFGTLLCWLLGVGMAVLPLIDGDSGIDMALRTLFLAIGVAFTYWLIYAKRGPGLDGTIVFLKRVAQPLTRLPEPTRYKLAFPVFVAALIACLYTTGWLVISDEASQKRVLFGSYDPQADIQWFHHGDSIDLYVYSETLDVLYEDAVSQAGNYEEPVLPGVHIRYSGEVMERTGGEFSSMVNNDIKNARVGKLERIQGDAEAGLHVTKRSLYRAISFHGAFGFNGHGGLEVLMMSIVAAFFVVMALANKLMSYHLLGGGLLLLALSAVPSAIEPELPQPETLEVFSEGSVLAEPGQDSSNIS